MGLIVAATREARQGQCPHAYIKTGTGESATNDNQPIGLARVGLWFNEHVAVGLEGSYWQRKTQLMEVGQPTRTVASTATVPLYLHFGRRFPFMMYAGIGRGWESNEYLVLDSSGTKQRMTKGDSGLAWVAGAGFEYAWTQHVSVTVLARAIRTRIDSAPHVGEKRERDVLSFGVVLSRH
jgi:opacity protein-like surface antigen